jgi:NAD(P)-dependent dehydrogenase (short-subunit alcohol dehydrogenase family)
VSAPDPVMVVTGASSGIGAATARAAAAAANAGFGAKRGFLQESPEHWREMVLCTAAASG